MKLMCNSSEKVLPDELRQESASLSQGLNGHLMA
jgi:hypothetical protein